MHAIWHTNTRSHPSTKSIKSQNAIRQTAPRAKKLLARLAASRPVVALKPRVRIPKIILSVLALRPALGRKQGRTMTRQDPSTSRRSARTPLRSRQMALHRGRAKGEQSSRQNKHTLALERPRPCWRAVPMQLENRSANGEVESDLQQIRMSNARDAASDTK